MTVNATDPALQAADPTKRNVLLLCIALALSNTGVVIVMTVMALSGAYLARPDVMYFLPMIGSFAEPALSTFPLSIMFVATMIAAPLAAALMARIGRRGGFSIGQLVGAAGGVVGAYALYAQDFWMLSTGGILLGIHNAFWQQYRFAVADTASAEFKPKAISYVMIGPIAAGLFGPEIAKHTRDFFEPVFFAGCFVALTALAFVTVAVLQFIRIPPPPKRTELIDTGRPLSEIAKDPRFVIAVLSGMVGYATMSFIMTATPLAMIDCGFGFNDAAFVIQGHVIAMFAPSFFTGHLIKRYGVTRIILTGAFLYLLSTAFTASGIEMFQFFAGLVLLGVAWNFMFVGATTLLTDCYRPEEKAKVQGLNDFLVFGSVAIASLMSGALLQGFGWFVVTLSILGPVTVAGLCVLVLGGRARRMAEAA